MANFTDSLRKYFNIGFKSKAEKDVDKIFPLKDDPKKVDKQLNKGEIHSKIKDTFPSKVQTLFDWWISDTHITSDTWKNIFALFTDCEAMFMNSGIMSRAAEVTSDNTVPLDTNTQPLIVEAKRKQKKFILDFFDKINIYRYLRPTAASIIKYGNSGWVLSYDQTGISEVIPTNVFSIKNRLEFSPAKVQELMDKKNRFLSDYMSKSQRIEQLVSMITNKDNIESYFKKYLFGFVVGDYTLPPWRFLHFRNFDLESPFDPFGVPVFIYSLAPYMQLDAGMTMQVAMRGASFPKDVYKITMPASMPPSEKLSAAIEFSRDLQNSGINAVVKEKDGVGEVFITIDGLYEYTQETPNIDLGKVGDLEMLKDDLILSTLLPRYILDPNDGGFGDSGVAMVEKWKPFARTIYRIQSALLEQISQLVKIQMIYSKEFSLDEIDFILKMPYPESQTNEEIVRSQNDLLELSNNIIDTLSDKYMGGEPLPTDVKTDIYKKFLPYDDKIIDEWIKEIEKESGDVAEVKDNSDNSDDDKEDSNNSDDDNKDDIDKKSEQIRKGIIKNKWRMVEKTKGKQNLKEEIKDVIIDAKQGFLREGSLRGYHYYSSKNVMKDFPAEWLRKFEKEAVEKEGTLKKLDEEEFKVSAKKYKFKNEVKKRNNE